MSCDSIPTLAPRINVKTIKFTALGINMKRTFILHNNLEANFPKKFMKEPTNLFLVILQRTSFNISKIKQNVLNDGIKNSFLS